MNNLPSLISNGHLVCTSLYSFEGHFKQDQPLAVKYKQTINEYVNKGQVRRLSEKKSKLWRVSLTMYHTAE